MLSPPTVDDFIVYETAEKLLFWGMCYVVCIVLYGVVTLSLPASGVAAACAQCQSRSICTGLAERVEALKGEFVIQQYVERPLLVKERKVTSLSSNSTNAIPLLVTVSLFRIMYIDFLSTLSLFQTVSLLIFLFEYFCILFRHYCS